jgi:hypothetical protein
MLRVASQGEGRIDHSLLRHWSPGKQRLERWIIAN